MQCRLAIGLFVTVLSFSQIVPSQLPKPAVSGQAVQPPASETPQDQLGRTTPRGTVMGFLNAAYSQKYDIAAQYLDSHLQGKDAAALAYNLFFVLDRRLPAKLNSISNIPLGSMSNPADSKRELIGRVVTKRGGVDIYLERIDRPNGVPIWLFAPDTLAGIPNVYDEINATTLAEHILPGFMFRKLFGLTLFGWFFFLIFLPLEYLVLSVINRLVGVASGYAMRHWAGRPEARNPTVLHHPVRLLIVSATIFATLHEVGLSLLARQAGTTAAVLLLIVAFAWAMFLVNARCEVYFKQRMESRGRRGATAVLRPARRVMDLMAIIAGLIFLLHAFGINPTATLAGLGVGGIAVALAAQKTLENMIGGASLIMDGAVRVGDFFKIGDILGTIEVIGLRSTRVRTLDRTLVTIPNGQMATMTLENMSVRDQFWFRHLIGIEYRTTPCGLEAALSGVRGLLENDARVIAGSSRIRFLRITESSLELEAFAYVSAKDSNHFLEIQEELLIKIRDSIAAAGVKLAYPSRSIYLKDEIVVIGSPPGTANAKAISDKEASYEMHAR